MKTSQKIYLPFKRLIGIVGSFVGIIVCFALLWWWVIPVNAIVTKGHPFFARHRIGKDGKPFRCFKFRSMRNDANPHMTSRDSNMESQITGFGKFLRKTSIDETPQLLNILAGHMAFIGPRPLIDVNEDAVTIELRKENGASRLRPGLSGYAQIHKRGDLDPKTKAMFDGIYFKHFSLWWDIKIFVYTILCVFGAVKGR
ncbi:MAG: sugar transferase [Erysipelotrichaceae bacterium]|nr:sugar transferase [Erysipelotrichaceae bacterium]